MQENTNFLAFGMCHFYLPEIPLPNARRAQCPLLPFLLPS